MGITYYFKEREKIQIKYNTTHKSRIKSNFIALQVQTADPQFLSL